MKDQTLSEEEIIAESIVMFFAGVLNQDIP